MQEPNNRVVTKKYQHTGNCCNCGIDDNNTQIHKKSTDNNLQYVIESYILCNDG